MDLLEKLWSLRREIILSGKQSKKYRALAKHKDPEDKRAKYNDPADVDESGAIKMDDVVALQTLIQRELPVAIGEIGTWFGTSACVMLAVCKHLCIPGAKIYTCDKHDVYVPVEEYRPCIDYTVSHSDKWLKGQAKRLRKFDFLFVDATLTNKSVGLLKDVLEVPMRIAFHDAEKGKKGETNIAKVKQHYRKKASITTELMGASLGNSSSIAYIEVW